MSIFDNLRKKPFVDDELESKHPLNGSSENMNMTENSMPDDFDNVDSNSEEIIKQHIDSQKSEDLQLQNKKSNNIKFVELPKWIDMSNLKAIELNLSTPNSSGRSFLKGVNLYVKDDTKCRNKVFLSSVEIQVIINYLQAFLSNQLPVSNQKSQEQENSSIFVILTPSPKLVVHLDFLDSNLPFHIEFTKVESRFFVDLLNGVRLKYPFYLDYNYNHLKKINLRNGGNNDKN